MPSFKWIGCRQGRKFANSSQEGPIRKLTQKVYIYNSGKVWKILFQFPKIISKGFQHRYRGGRPIWRVEWAGGWSGFWVSALSLCLFLSLSVLLRAFFSFFFSLSPSLLLSLSLSLSLSLPGSGPPCHILAGNIDPRLHVCVYTRSAFGFSV